MAQHALDVRGALLKSGREEFPKILSPSFSFLIRIKELKFVSNSSFTLDCISAFEYVNTANKTSIHITKALIYIVFFTVFTPLSAFFFGLQTYIPG